MVKLALEDLRMKYDYLENVKEDVKTAILDNCTKEEIKNAFKSLEARDELYEKLYDNLWIDDNVTGNASGSYTCNAYNAEEYLCHNWDLLVEALEEFGESESDALSRGAEYCDVTIRCYLLGSAIKEALDELEGELEEE